MRTFLIVLASLFVLLLFGAGAAWYWWHVHGNEVMTSSQAELKEGRRRGASLDETGCVDEALGRRSAGATDAVTAALNRTFWLTACLDASRPSAALCDGAPAPDELVKLHGWTSARCEGKAGDAETCRQVYQLVASYCVSPRRHAKAGR